MKTTISTSPNVVTLQVVRVRATSSTASDGFDERASKELQNVGFVSLKKVVGGWIEAKAPQENGEHILLEHEIRSQNDKRKPFRLIRVKDGNPIKFEEGTTFDIEERSLFGGEKGIEVFCSGTRLSTWEIECRPLNGRYLGFPAKTPEPPPQKPDASLSVLPLVELAIPVFPKEDQILKIPLDEIVCFQKQEADPSFSGQPRKHFNEADLEALARDIRKRGQKIPALVCRIDGIPGKKWELIAGERRWQALQLIGSPYLRALEEKPGSKKEQHMLSLVENLFRVDPSPLEISNALQEQVEAGETQVSLAEATSLSLTQVRKLLSIQTVHPDLKILLGPDVPEETRIRLNEASILGKIHLDHQVEIWNEAKTQPSRGLILAKLNELGRPFFQHKRPNRHNEAREVTKRIDRRFKSLNLTLMELKAVTDEKWLQFVGFKGTKQVSDHTMTHLVKTIRAIDEVKQKILQAMTSTRSTTLGCSE